MFIYYVKILSEIAFLYILHKLIARDLRTHTFWIKIWFWKV